jgi:hypothetical protein
MQMSCNQSFEMIHRRFNSNIICSGEQNIGICEDLSLKTPWVSWEIIIKILIECMPMISRYYGSMSPNMQICSL